MNEILRGTVTPSRRNQTEKAPGQDAVPSLSGGVESADTLIRLSIRTVQVREPSHCLK